MGYKINVFIILIITCFIATGISVAQNVSVIDYTVPTSYSSSLFIDPNYNLKIVDKETTVNRGSVGLVYKTFYESLPIGFSVDAIGSGAFEKTPDSKEYQTSYSMSIATQFKKFVWNDKNIFGSVKLNGQYNKAYDYPATSVTIGIGYGRFVNATPLRKAVRMEDFLSKENVISGHLPKKTMLDLGHMIERQSEYQDKYGRTYRKYWFDDMESSMRKSGMLKGESIGAIGILRMQEVLTREQILDRFYGWDATIGTKIDITLPQKDQKRSKPSIDISVRYSRPISWSVQWNERLSVNSPFSEYFGDVYEMNLDSDVAYELSNRISFVARHSITVDNAKDEDRLIVNSLGLSFIYFLENHVNFVATEQVNKFGDEDLTTNFVVSLNYRVF